jgi:general secretion pathway protein G
LKKRKARGFTLVELLIVVVIIGVLAGSMLLVFGSTTDKAKATRVMSDMRNLKAAALMMYADKDEWPNADGEVTDGTEITEINEYMDRANWDKGPDGIAYEFGDQTVSEDEFYGIFATSIPGKINERLADAADNSGIVIVTSGDDGSAFMMIKKGGEID